MFAVGEAGQINEVEGGSIVSCIEEEDTENRKTNDCV